jgi:hypothetical protein
MLSDQELQRRWSSFYYIVAVGTTRANTGLFLFTHDGPESEVPDQCICCMGGRPMHLWLPVWVFACVGGCCVGVCL